MLPYLPDTLNHAGSLNDCSDARRLTWALRLTVFAQMPVAFRKARGRYTQVQTQQEISPMNIDLKRYDLFGWDYEYVNSLPDREVAWYVKFARETRGPVLELACGTARLLVEIARAGFAIDGIDLSPGMLEIAERRIAQLPSEIRSLIRTHRMDMSDFHLNRMFGLIFIADNSLRELKTSEQQLSCLKCIQRHLRPGGKCLITERRFDPEKFAHGRHDIPWAEPISHPVTGDLVQRKIAVELSEDGKWIRGVMVYKTIHANGSETVEECPFEAPVMVRDDYICLFAEAGFSPSVFVDYEEQEDDGKNPILCFVCDKEEGVAPAYNSG